MSRKTQLLGLSATGAIRALLKTQRFRVFYHDPAVDPRLGVNRPRIYIFWHEYILTPLYLRGHCNIAMLLSRHKDADALVHIAGYMGYDCVRGSSNRGGTSALREMARRGQHMHLTITPDGPRGPRRHLALGPIYLASQLGMPIVPLGFGADRPWRLKSWDRFVLPRPFSRVRSVIGNEITIPPQLDREQLETHRREVEQVLNDLTLDAEQWAASGATRQGEVIERRRTGLQTPPTTIRSHAA